MSKPRSSSLGFRFFLMGGLAWIVAALFAVLNARVAIKDEDVRMQEYAPNVVAAGAAIGFGVGGGLCFLGSALLYRSDRSSFGTSSDPAEPAGGDW